MARSFRRFLSLLFCLVLVLTLFPFAAMADEPGNVSSAAAEEPEDEQEGTIALVSEEDPIEATSPVLPEDPAEPLSPSIASGSCGAHLSWTLSEAGTLTISGTGDMSDFPYKGYSSTYDPQYDPRPWINYVDQIQAVDIQTGVTSIGERAFTYCGNISSVTIADTVTSIGDYVFLDCSSLASITIPDSVTSLGWAVFEGCSSLTTITLPYGITEIPLSAFEDCTSLVSVNIPDSVTSIAVVAFRGCSSLASLTIPNSVTYIGDAAFQYCTGLTSVTFGTGLSTLEGYAFDECSSLSTIRFLGSAPDVPFYEDDLADNIYPPVFDGVTANGYYPSQNETWDGDAFESLAGDINWIAEVTAKPVIAHHPSNRVAKEDSTVKFTVIASGADLSYQWQWSKDNGNTWNDSSSATPGYNSSTLSVTASASRNGYLYRCVVSNGVGSVNSNSAKLTVKTKPVITTQPKNVTAGVGGTAKFTVAASGSGLSYQWQWSKDGGKTWNDSSSSTTGYNTANLQVTATTARNGFFYRCKVSNSGGTATSGFAILTVSPTPVITTQPKSVTVASGSTATFTVAASGSGLSYQWQWSKDGGNTWNDSSSATPGYNGKSLQVTATGSRNGYKYRCKVSNSNGTTISSAATLNLLTKPTITTQPKSITAYKGTTAKFTVVAKNAVSYRWQWRKNSSGTWTDCSSATTGYNTATLSVTAAESRNGYQYRCKVTNSIGTTYTSAATLTVSLKPVITTQPKSVTATAGGTAKFTVTAAGASSYRWQWRKGSSGTWTDCSSATPGYNTATLSVSAAPSRNGYQYRCKVTNSAGTTYSSAVTLTVK